MQAALTVEGKIGNFDFVDAGAYLDRNVDVAAPTTPTIPTGTTC